MSTLSPRIGVRSRRSRRSASTGDAGLGAPVDCTTRCQGTSCPCRLITAPTVRPEPDPTYSATSPYDMTLPRGIRSTTSRTATAYGVGRPPSTIRVPSPADTLAACCRTAATVGLIGRQGGVDLGGPGRHAALHVHRVAEPGRLDPGQRLRRPHAGLAVEHQRPVLRQLGQRLAGEDAVLGDQYAARDLHDLVLDRL